MKRNIYLNSMDLEDALELYLKNIPINIEEEIISVKDSLGRVCSQDIMAKLSSPHYNSSAMDGICINSKNTYGACETNYINLNNNMFKLVDTGDPIDDEFNCVIPIEELIVEQDNSFSISKAYYPYQNVRNIGEDISFNEMIIPKYTIIEPEHIGVLLNTLNNEIRVYKRLLIGILPTGTEIVDSDKIPLPGEIIESNSSLLKALINRQGVEAKVYPITKDNYIFLKDKIIEMAFECDIVIVNAGSSAGSEDFTKSIIEDIGECYVHGLNIKPGKPAILGVIKKEKTGISKDKIIVGIPGFPGSAYLIYDLIFNKIVNLHYGQNEKVEKIKAILASNVISNVKSKEFIRVRLGRIKDTVVASVLPRGAGMLMPLIKSDGLLVVDKNLEGYKANDEVEIIVNKRNVDFEKTIVSNGSHDVLLDKINSMLFSKGMFLSSTHTGSLGGIMALKRGYAHIAPIHLLDEKDGNYNIAYIKKYLGENGYSLIKGFKRLQGLILPKGNPLNIKGLEDLTREDVIFVNRQKGSGTRVLLDYELKRKNIDIDKINGYQNELSTHMMVASFVVSAKNKVGLGIMAAANAFELDFLPIGIEEYDFVIDNDILDSPMIDEFLKVLVSDSFIEYGNNYGGYSFEETGRIIRL
jgi:putative molybdopterin biosynthesis protein